MCLPEKYTKHDFNIDIYIYLIKYSSDCFDDIHFIVAGSSIYLSQIFHHLIYSVKCLQHFGKINGFAWHIHNFKSKFSCSANRIKRNVTQCLCLVEKISLCNHLCTEIVVIILENLMEMFLIWARGFHKPKWSTQIYPIYQLLRFILIIVCRLLPVCWLCVMNPHFS